MVKSGYRPHSRIPEWAKLPQYKEAAAKIEKVKDVEMEDVEMAVEGKLVMRRGLRRKRTRNDSMFSIEEESSIKRFKAPDPRRVQSEQIPVFNGMLTIPVKNKQRQNEIVPLYINRQKALSMISGYIPESLASEFVSNWKTAQPKPIDLTHEDSSLVKNYLDWIGTQKVAIRERPRWASTQDKSRPDYKDEMTIDTEHLALCYSLGKRLQDVNYRKQILCTMRHCVVMAQYFPSDQAVAIIYKNTKKRSPARKMMVDFWTFAGDAAWIKSNSIGSAVCHGFLEDLVPALLRERAKPADKVWPWVENPEVYLIM